MFKIGDFSKLNKISVKALRYYDDLGILKPYKIDAENSYRYYSASQLPRLNRILALKDLGLSLKEIANILDSKLCTDTVLSMLSIKENEIKKNIESEKEKLLKLENLINKINEEDLSMLKYDVVIKKIDPIKVASIRSILPNYESQHNIWRELGDYLKENNVKMTPPCLVIYYDPGFKECDVDAEIAEHVLGTAPDTDRIKFKELDSVHEMACTVHKGGYEGLPSAYAALQNWIEDNNYKIAGPNRELYLEGEWSKDSVDEYITEIQIPVTK